MRVECCAASRPQQGRTQNEDAFLIHRGAVPFVALCDGAGNAQLAAKRVLTLFEKLVAEECVEELVDAVNWKRWAKILDSSLLGGAQSTFISLAVVGQVATGVCVGDSRAYLIDRDGRCQISTEGAAKQRLGSGAINPFSLRFSLNSRDILLLMSDGAWTPLNLGLLQRTVMGAAVRHFTEIPGAILDVAGRAGRADDMTVVALRLVPRMVLE